MKGSEIFRAEKTAKKMGVSHRELTLLKESVRKEFPDDDLMYELHLLRALKCAHRKKQQKETAR